MFYQLETSPDGVVGRKGHIAETEAAKVALQGFIDRGAKFYTYLCQEIMLVEGQIVDLFCKTDVTGVLIRKLKMSPYKVNNSLCARVRMLAMPLCQQLPEGELGTVNGIKEPKLKMTKRLSKPVRYWLHAVLNSNKLLGVQNEN